MQALAPGVVFWDLVDCPQVFRGVPGTVGWDTTGRSGKGG